MQRADAAQLKHATRFRRTTNEFNVSKYEKVEEYQYSAGADGEAIIVIPTLIGMRVITIEREIKPLLSGDYGFNSFNGQITLLNGVQLSIGETIFIMYAKTVIE